MQPLRGSKGMLYEGGIRVPLIIRWPNVVKSGEVCDIPVIGIDLFPTLLNIAGIKPDEGLSFDGESLLPRLTGQESLH